MPHGITPCYLPPGRGDIPALVVLEIGVTLGLERAGLDYNLAVTVLAY